MRRAALASALALLLGACASPEPPALAPVLDVVLDASSDPIEVVKSVPHADEPPAPLILNLVFDQESIDSWTDEATQVLRAKGYHLVAAHEDAELPVLSFMNRPETVACPGDSETEEQLKRILASEGIPSYFHIHQAGWIDVPRPLWGRAVEVIESHPWLLHYLTLYRPEPSPLP